MLIAEAGSDPLSFWGAVGLAAAIATALATAASVIVALWARSYDRQEAEFITHLVSRGYDSGFTGFLRAPEAAFRVQNVGDGPAYKVRVTESSHVEKLSVGEGSRRPNGDRRPQTMPVPVMQTGDELWVSVRLKGFEDWDDGHIIVSWWPPPTRKKNRWFFFSREQKVRIRMAEVTTPPLELPEGKRPTSQ